MKHTQVAPAASLKPDNVGNLRTDNTQELATNTLDYLGEQISLSLVATGSVAAIALIGLAAVKRSHNRSRAAEKLAAEARHASQRAARLATLETRNQSIKKLGERTNAIIAESRAAPAKRIREEFTRRAMELEANRPKGILGSSLGELVALAQTNRALPVTEEAYYSSSSDETSPARPMSRTTYRSLAAYKEFYDETIPQDSGYHPILNAERLGVYNLMVDLEATAPIGDPHVTAAYPLVVPHNA